MAEIVDTGKVARDAYDHTRTQAIYNSLDATVCHELHGIFASQISASPAARLIYDFERGLRAPALEMMIRGLRVDPNERRRMIIACEDRISLLKEVLNAIVAASLGWLPDSKGWRLNPASPARLKYFFYGVLGLPEEHKFSGGERKVTVNREALEKFQDTQAGLVSLLCRLILAIRDLGKTVGTLRWAVERDGRMRFGFSPTATTTGRWSSSSNVYGRSGNAQNITDRIRRIFVADPGRKFAYCDLCSAESTTVAYLAADDAYIAANTGSLKVHTFVARMVWPEVEWPADPAAATRLAKHPFYRQFSRYHLAKIGSHSSNYGARPETQAHHLRVALQVMRDFQDRYFSAFPGIEAWQNEVARKVQLDGTLTTPLGRRRRFFGRSSDKSVIREALAYLPQSTVADILNLAMFRVWKTLWPQVRVLSQLHDAILIDYPEEAEDTLLPAVLELMKIPVKIGPYTMVILADAEVGWNWSEGGKANPDGLILWQEAHDTRCRTIPAEIPMEDLIL